MKEIELRCVALCYGIATLNLEMNELVHFRTECSTTLYKVFRKLIAVSNLLVVSPASVTVGLKKI